MRLARRSKPWARFGRLFDASGAARVSLRQPVLLYASLFMLALAALVLTLSAMSLVNASRRAYGRAALNELSALALRGPAAEVLRAVEHSPRDLERELAVVTANRPALGVDLIRARAAARNPSTVSDLLAVPLSAAGEESYLIAVLDPSIPTAIAFVEVSRLIPFVLIAALGCAALLAFMMSRLLLPPLNVLAEVARDATALRDGPEARDAPTEILEIAGLFRGTVRLLRDEQATLAAQKRELEEVQASLVRASKLASVGRLAAGIAHEIGNPLAAVLGYLSLLREGLEEPARSDVLERCSKELTRIAETIQKLLTYARTGEERLEPKRPLATRRVVEEALALVRAHPSFRGVEVELADWPDTEDALGHAGRLNQVLVNLLLNAAQAVGSQSARRIRISRDVTDDDIRITVEDNGPGIERAHAEQVFDPFFTTKAPGEGTGLGLAVSRALMETMSGDLLLEEPGGESADYPPNERPLAGLPRLGPGLGPEPARPSANIPSAQVVSPHAASAESASADLGDANVPSTGSTGSGGASSGARFVARMKRWIPPVPASVSADSFAPGAASNPSQAMR